MSNVFNKKICGGLFSCKSRYYSIWHLEELEYFWLCGNKAFSETKKCVIFFWTVPCLIIVELQVVVKVWAIHATVEFWWLTSYTKRCTKTRRVCWSKFGRNLTKNFCVICILVSLSLIPRQDLYLDFACLPIYSLAINPELFVCLSIYENAETLSPWFPCRCFCFLSSGPQC